MLRIRTRGDKKASVRRRPKMSKPPKSSPASPAVSRHLSAAGCRSTCNRRIRQVTKALARVRAGILAARYRTRRSWSRATVTTFSARSSTACAAQTSTNKAATDPPTCPLRVEARSAHLNPESTWATAAAYPMTSTALPTANRPKRKTKNLLLHSQ